MITFADNPALFRFFADECNFRTFSAFVKGRNDISLTLLEHFVARYARQHSTRYTIRQIDGSERTFYVHDRYSAALGSLGKALFDPFARKTKYSLPICFGDEIIETSVGQLNFFRWAISNGVIDYVSEHLAEIRDHWQQFKKNSS